MEHVSTEERERRRGRLVRGRIPAALLGAACLALLLPAVTLEPGDSLGRMFGLWRIRHIGAAALLVWMALAVRLLGSSEHVQRRFLAVNGGLLAVWTALELAGLFLVSWPELLMQDPPPQIGREAVPSIDVEGEAYEDLASTWGLATEPIPYRYTTDRHGFRNVHDREHAAVYLLGDSILVGGLVAAEETLHAQLEARIGVPVSNVALLGLSPQEERDLLFDSGVPLKNSLVLHFVFEGNDLRDSGVYRRRQSGVTPGSFWSRSLLGNLSERLQSMTVTPEAMANRYMGTIDGADYLFGWTRTSSFENRLAELSAITVAMGELRDAVKKAGGTYAVVLVPAKIRVLGPFCAFPESSLLDPFQHHLSPLPAHVKRWCEAARVPWIDLVDDLVESTCAGDVPWFPGDTHWNDTGHAVAAEALARWSFMRECMGGSGL